MKKVLFLAIASLVLVNVNAHQYDMFDINGKHRGSIDGGLDKSALEEFAKKNQGSVLVKRNIAKKIYANKKIGQAQKNLDIKRSSFENELWIEVEKNESVKACFDSRVLAWETSLNSKIYNDSCLVFQTPIFVGVETIDVYFNEVEDSYKINLSVGMKYLEMKKEKVLLGYEEKKYDSRNKWVNVLYNKQERNEDPERIVSVSGTYLVDKYPVTNCEITQLLWDSIPMNPSFKNKTRSKLAEKWLLRKRWNTRGENCVTQDSAANTVFLLQAMEYANARSIREGLKPYYIFSAINANEEKILSKGQYVIGYLDFSMHKEKFIQVSVNDSSDGYRLPYYNEWMMFARGGDLKNKALWGDSSVAFEEVSKYARFATGKNYFESEPVGQLQPNGYGLYDIFGLVWEHVIFEEKNPFVALQNHPACLKGGNNRVVSDYKVGKFYSEPYWKQLNYGYSKANLGGMMAGFRLVRKIK